MAGCPLLILASGRQEYRTHSRTGCLRLVRPDGIEISRLCDIGTVVDALVIYVAEGDNGLATVLSDDREVDRVLLEELLCELDVLVVDVLSAEPL